MIGWLEASWANVIVACVTALLVVVLFWSAIEELPFRRHAPRPRGDWDIRELTDEDSQP